MFAFQEDFVSDNDKYRGLERFRRFLGGLKRIQKANEFYLRHKFDIYAAQAVVILLILFVLFYR
jgi:hypothetical protein